MHWSIRLLSKFTNHRLYEMSEKSKLFSTAVGVIHPDAKICAHRFRYGKAFNRFKDKFVLENAPSQHEYVDAHRPISSLHRKVIDEVNNICATNPCTRSCVKTMEKILVLLMINDFVRIQSVRSK